MPEDLDRLERDIRQLEIEREAVKRDGNENKLASINEEIANLEEESKQLRARWQQEKDLIQTIQRAKGEIDDLKVQAENLEREGSYDKVAEIRYGEIPDLEETIAETSAKLDEIQQNGSLLKEEVDDEDIAEIVSRWTGVPVSSMLESERQKLLRMEDELSERVVGQPEAIRAVSNAVRRGRSGFQEERQPIGSFIFLGTTGVGKTELSKALAEFLFNDEDAMVRIDMSEYQERHTVSRLVGAPPGYVGHEEGGQLTERVRRKPYSVVLLDEIEKAHSEALNILLQVLDDGRLTDNKGRTTDFTNTIIIMTSNLGSDVIRERVDAAGGSLSDAQEDQLRDELMKRLKRELRPEFLNRIDETVMFHMLGREEIAGIVDIQFRRVRRLAERNHNLELELTDAAKDWLAERGFDPAFGARPLKRVMQQAITNRLAEQTLSGDIANGALVVIDTDEDGLAFETGEAATGEAEPVAAA
jgi:ATP-dependent Clp protease ATP-binding subunit ClpB